MEPSRKELIERIEAGYEAFNRGDFEAASALFHPDIVWNRVAEVERPVRGAEAARGLIEPQVFATQRNEIHSIEFIGDHVLVEATFHGVGAASGIELNERAFHLWRMRDGQVVEFSYFLERADALAAAGPTARDDGRQL